jgi:hypothetical protein
MKDLDEIDRCKDSGWVLDKTSVYLREGGFQRNSEKPWIVWAVADVRGC